ncbi:hypothetical protein YC2023_019532 [Brassica napus]
MIDYYGVLDSDWISVRNNSFLQRFSLIQSQLQAPDPQPKVNNLVFHPLSGLCMLQSFLDPTKVTLGRCNESQLWNYSTDNTLKLQNKSLCLANTGPNAPVVKLSETSCSSSNLCKWQTISASKMLLAATYYDCETISILVLSLIKAFQAQNLYTASSIKNFLKQNWRKAKTGNTVNITEIYKHSAVKILARLIFAPET